MSTEPRNDGRAPDDLRADRHHPGFVRTATGSALIEAGGTRVICTASVDEDVPRWMAGQGRGWVTAEYGMLPASTGERKRRDVSKGRPDGRTRRDPAPDRPLAARRRSTSRRSASARSGSTATCSRPTAAPAAPRSPAATWRSSWRCGASSARASSTRCRSPQSVAAVSCGMVDGARAARPRLLGGLHGRGRRQRGHDRRRRARRGPGHRRAHAALARLARRAARPRRRRDRRGCAPPRRRRSAAADAPAEPCGWSSPPATSTSCASSSRADAPARARPAARRRRAAARDRHDLRRQRARQGARRGGRDRPARRSPTTRASRPRRSAARPGVWSARYAGEDATDEENLAKLLREVPPDGDRAWRTCARSPTSSPAGARRSCTAAARARSPTSRAASGGFGYDPAFVPDDYPGDERTMAELDARGEGRDQPPRPRGARAGDPAGARRGGGAPARARSSDLLQAEPAVNDGATQRGAPRCSASPPPSSSWRSSSPRGSSPARSPSSPRPSTRAPTWWPRCSRCSRSAWRSARPTASTTTATARPSTWRRSARARS